MEINVITLHTVVETTPQQMRSVIKAKGGSMKYKSVHLFFVQAVSLSSVQGGAMTPFSSNNLMSRVIHPTSYPIVFYSVTHSSLKLCKQYLALLASLSSLATGSALIFCRCRAALSLLDNGVYSIQTVCSLETH